MCSKITMDVSLHRGINLKALAADTFWSDQFVFGFWYFHEHCYCQNFLLLPDFVFATEILGSYTTAAFS